MATYQLGKLGRRVQVPLSAQRSHMVAYRKYTRELLGRLAAESQSVAGVLRKLGLQKWSGGQHLLVSKRLREYKIDVSHFTGKGANKGLSHCGGPDKKSWSQILVKRSSSYRAKAYHLRRALIESGRDYVCGVCGQLPMWNSKPLRLQVEHSNGDFLDCRPENLEFLCPNCHSQTSGSGGEGLTEVTSEAKLCRERRRRRGGMVVTHR